MALRLTHEALTSFAVSAMLTSAFLASAPDGRVDASAGPQPQAVMNALIGLRASGWAGTEELMAPDAVAEPQTAAAAPAAPALTADQRKKLAALLAAYGLDAALNKIVTAPLGMTKGDEVLTLRQLTTNKNPNIRAYIPLSDGGLFLAFIDTDVSTAWDYRLDADLKLIAAISQTNVQAAVVIPIPDAELKVQTELAYWAAVADRH